MGNEALRAGKLGLSSILSARLVLDVANKLDATFVAGDGTPVVGRRRTTPLGIVNFAGITQISVCGGVILHALIGAVGTAMLSNVPLTKLR